MKIRFTRKDMSAFLTNGYEVESSYACAKNYNPAQENWFDLASKYSRIAYDNWHFTWLRKQPSLPSTIWKMGLVERLLRAPSSFLIKSEDKNTFFKDDFLLKRSVIDRGAVKALSRFLHSQENYFDIYRGQYKQKGLSAPDAPATIYVRTVDFVRSEAFWGIITSPGLYETAINIMGRNAKITWAWLWYSDPKEVDAYQNQNWHRDTGEPFNFIRFFVPLTDVKDANDGPTIVVKNSSRKEVLYERRRFSEEEVVSALGTDNTIMALSDIGDMYCANTFCLHRGLPPKRPREMLSLLVSYQNSYRTKGLPLVPLSSLGAEQRDYVSARKYFFSEICDFKR